MNESLKTVMPRFLAVDFFSGAGGTTRGLIDAGGYVIAGIDKEVACGETYEANNVNGSLDCRPARFVSHNVFPRSKACPEGGQAELIEFSQRDLIHHACLVQPLGRVVHGGDDLRSGLSHRGPTLQVVCALSFQQPPRGACAPAPPCG